MKGRPVEVLVVPLYDVQSLARPRSGLADREISRSLPEVVPLESVGPSADAFEEGSDEIDVLNQLVAAAGEVAEPVNDQGNAHERVVKH